MVSLFPLPWPLHLGVPLVLAAVLGVLASTPLFRNLEYRVYDSLLALRSAPPEDERIVLINIDDGAVGLAGQWPWPRDRIADGLLLLSELGAQRIVLDVSYVDPSPPVIREEEFRALLETGASLDRIEFRSPDEVLAGTIGLLRTVDLPLVLRPASDGLPGLADARKATVGVPVEGPLPTQGAVTAGGVLEDFAAAAGALGFANTRVDADGVTRRTDLIVDLGAGAVPHLVLPTFLELAGIERVEVVPGEFRFFGADGSVRRLAADEAGRILVDWPHGTYEESFTQRSYADLLRIRRLEGDLLANLRAMEAAGYFAYAEGALDPGEAYELFRESYDQALDANRALLDEAFQVKRVYLSVAGSFLQGPARARMIDEVRSLVAAGDLGADAGAELTSEVEAVFEATSEIHRALIGSRRSLQEALEGRVAFVGFTATATTDIGVVPFDEEYVKLGIHASILNTLLSPRPLREASPAVSVLVALVAGLVIAVAIRRRRPAVSLSVGASLAALVVAGLVVFFVVSGTYIAVLAPVVTSVATFGVVTALAFVETEREKGWLFNAFEHYISREFVQELVKHPEKLDLGGQERELTALFTDVRGFSTIAESLEPSRLVDLLNSYLGEMSDLILEEAGTIDKYEGDAIVAFFGAPMDLPDHAARACRAALRMKAVERVLNERYLSESLSPAPLLTRIGINTGDMVVGNMGTERRMDYTIMGHNANLASRLEGANKEYGTWILAGESTMRSAGGEFVFRPLDRVRVAGIESPVRLCELVGFLQDETPSRREALEIFAEAMVRYDAGDFAEAQARFAAVLKIYPDDGPARAFERRCRDYAETPPNGAWDGVHRLAGK